MRNLLIIFLIFILFICISGGIFYLWFNSLPIPDFETFEERKVIQSTKIYDRTGEKLLYDVHKNIKRTVIPYEDIPLYIKNATVAIEDETFYQHKGISIVGIIRALTTNLKQGRIKGQGGSTITQQLVKNTFLTPEKTFTRKIKEAFLAFKFENIFSKEEILTLYLNEIPYGGSNYGIEAAAQSFFNKNTKDLTLAESVYLAALPQAPSYYSPYGLHIDDLKIRKNLVLEKMLELNFIEENQYINAKEEEVVFSSANEKGITAPHFVMYIKNYLEENYGKDMVENGGLKVTTSINLDLQKEAEKMVKEYVKDIEEKFNAGNAGIIGIDPKTGQILVMVGSRDYFDENYEGKFNVTLAKRQPGSSFKPFVYATAFKEGYTTETIVFDLKTEFNLDCNPDGTYKNKIIDESNINPEERCYHPKNYDDVYRGPVTLRNALAQSINVPAVKTLYLTGLSDSLKTAQDLGITSLIDPLKYGLTLVLGGGEASLLEMTSAYSVFANNGVRNKTTGILKIEDNQGNILEEFNFQPNQVLSIGVSQMINDILSDNKARTPAFGERSYLYFPDREVAVKTGTTNDYRDAWVIGYTPNFALGLWVGNNDNTPMEKRVAGFIAAPLWNEFFKKVFEITPKENFTKQKNNELTVDIKPILNGEWRGGKIYYIDTTTNKPATENTPTELLEKRILTQVHSILYWVNKNNPNGPIPLNPEIDLQFNLWEPPVREWVENQKIIEDVEINPTSSI